MGKCKHKAERSQNLTDLEKCQDGDFKFVLSWVRLIAMAMV